MRWEEWFCRLPEKGMSQNAEYSFISGLLVWRTRNRTQVFRFPCSYERLLQMIATSNTFKRRRKIEFPLRSPPSALWATTSWSAVNPQDTNPFASQIPNMHQHTAWDLWWAIHSNSINCVTVIPRSPDLPVCGQCMIIWQAPRKDITSLNPHGFPSNRHSQHFCCWSASTWIIHHARKNRGGRNTSSVIACDVGACVQEKRAVQYMTRCFYSNVKPKQGVCLMELRGVTKPFASVSVCKWVHTQWILMLICRVKKKIDL